MPSVEARIVAANEVLTSPRKLFADPIGIAPQIQNGEDLRFRFGFAVINAERKPLGKHSAKTEITEMDPVVKRETFDVRHQ